jgi:hypothetical protein
MKGICRFSNMAANRATTERRTLYMLSLDMSYALGSISHLPLRFYLTQMRLPLMITEVICNSYEGATFKIIALNGPTNTIK